MIVVDTSAVLAVVFAEPDAADYAAVMAREAVRIGAATRLEAHIVASTRSGRAGVDALNTYLSEIGATVAPPDEDHAATSIAAWDRFGRGRHPAKLNFGDCLAYATAKQVGVPLLFKGDDFAQTDIPSAL